MPDQFKINMRLGRETPPGLSGKQRRGDRRRSLPFGRAMKEAQSALDAGDAERALAILEDLRLAHPSNPHALLHLGRARAAIGEMEAAEQAFYKAKEHSANNPVVDLFLGQAYLRHDDMEKAEEAIRRCLRQEPKNLVASNSLALCLFRQGRHREAFAIWNQAGWSGDVHFLVEFTIVFERFLLESPEIRPADFPGEDTLAALAAIGSVQPKPGRLQAIARSWRTRRLLRQAEARLMEQRTTEAWALTGKALTADPGNLEALMLRAVALYELGAYQGAARLLAASLREDNSVLPRCFLAYCLLRLGGIEIARAILSRIAIEGPFDYYLHYHLGLCRLIEGDLEGARRFFGAAYRDYFIDTREYCFEYLIHKVRSTIEAIEKNA
ncbi:MAG: tetratricopeptide repeat protein [candidate division BRC1 bacterium ADurb.BinA364]|nr:MAG: tetratricopeptide repeat protein [candidate division BRC1 bacterium ADurb.BinA364]